MNGLYGAVQGAKPEDVQQSASSGAGKRDGKGFPFFVVVL